MKRLGSVEVPQEAFLALLTKDKNKLIELSKEREPLYRESADIIFTHNTWEENIEETFNIFYDYIKNEISLSN